MYAGDGVGVSRRDYVIPFVILINAIDMKIVECSLSVVTISDKSLEGTVKWDMVGRSPFENQFARRNIYLLEESVIYPT